MIPNHTPALSTDTSLCIQSSVSFISYVLLKFLEVCQPLVADFEATEEVFEKVKAACQAVPCALSVPEQGPVVIISSDASECPAVTEQPVVMDTDQGDVTGVVTQDSGSSLSDANRIPVAEIVLSAHLAILLFTLYNRSAAPACSVPTLHAPPVPTFIPHEKCDVLTNLPRQSWWLPLRVLKAFLTLQDKAGTLLQDSVVPLVGAIQLMEAADRLSPSGMGEEQDEGPTSLHETDIDHDLVGGDAGEASKRSDAGNHCVDNRSVHTALVDVDWFDQLVNPSSSTPDMSEGIVRIQPPTHYMSQSLHHSAKSLLPTCAPSHQWIWNGRDFVWATDLSLHKASSPSVSTVAALAEGPTAEPTPLTETTLAPDITTVTTTTLAFVPASSSESVGDTVVNMPAAGVDDLSPSLSVPGSHTCTQESKELTKSQVHVSLSDASDRSTKPVLVATQNTRSTLLEGSLDWWLENKVNKSHITNTYKKGYNDSNTEKTITYSNKRIGMP